MFGTTDCYSHIEIGSLYFSMLGECAHSSSLLRLLKTASHKARFPVEGSSCSYFLPQKVHCFQSVACQLEHNCIWPQTVDVNVNQHWCVLCCLFMYTASIMCDYYCRESELPYIWGTGFQSAPHFRRELGSLTCLRMLYVYLG